MICQYCNKEFSSKITLYQHQQKAKYCLQLQGSTNTNYNCEHCNKSLSTNERLLTHLNACKIKKKKDEVSKENDLTYAYKNSIKDLQNEILNYQEKLREKNEYIAKLEAKLEKFENAVTNIATSTTHALEAKAVKAASSSTSSTTNNTTTNITVNNYLNLSQENVKKVLTERLNYNVVYAGQAGLATFVFDNILKDSTGKLIYRCVDASRQMFEFVDENGETVRDMKAEKLTQSLLKGDVIRLGLEAAAVGWNTENEKLNTERVGVFGPKVNEYADLNRNNTVFRSKVSSLTT
jgi:cell division septum initiation protein DivIVA